VARVRELVHWDGWLGGQSKDAGTQEGNQQQLLLLLLLLSVARLTA
jgi:hypothetical protein